MAEEAVTTQIANVPKTFIKRPFLALGIGAAVLFIVVAIEVFKPGVLTDPIRRLLGMAGIRKKS